MKKIKSSMRYFLTLPFMILYLVKRFIDDVVRFYLYSSVHASIFYGRSNNTLDKQEKLQAVIIADYHKIEKGLALKDPRPGFGVAVVQRLLDNYNEYLNKFGHSETLQVALTCLLEYQSFNKKNQSMNSTLNDEISKIVSTCNLNEFEDNGGTYNITRADIISRSKIDLSNFFASRHSIRNFSSSSLSLSDLKKAVKMAQKTPSVCNRQSSKVYLFHNKDDVNKVLSYQNGCASFAKSVQAVYIVTSNLESFISTDERNQCWIDGGLFAMSLLYALHSLGIGSCCLNWCATKKSDDLLHSAAGISKSEVVIMLIACGNYPNDLRVARSVRRPLDEVLRTKSL